MKKYLLPFFNLLILMCLLSCEKKEDKLLGIYDANSLPSNVDIRFSAYDFSKYGIDPIWEKASTYSNNVVELPFKFEGKSFKTRLTEPSDREGKGSLLVYKKGDNIIAEVVYFYPNENFTESLDIINLETYKSKKFNGIMAFQKLDESDMHIRFIVDGEVVGKKLGKNVLANANKAGGSNPNARECQTWGAFLVTYDQNGSVVSDRLLYTYDVCSGGDPSQDQPGPGSPENGNYAATYEAINQQLVYNVQNSFSWIQYLPNSYPANIAIYNSLRGCNIYGLLSNPLGPVELAGSYQTSTSFVGVCTFGSLSGSAMILAVSRATPDYPLYNVQTFHSGSISIDIQASITIGPGGGGGSFTLNQGIGVPLQWYRIQ